MGRWLDLTTGEIGVGYSPNGRFSRWIMGPARSCRSGRVPVWRGQRSPPASTLDEGAMDRRILVVDDSELVCQQLSQLLALTGRQIKVARDGTTALEWLVERNFSLVVTDLCLPGISGLELIQEVRRRHLPVTVIVMTGHASIDSAVAAIKLGAYDYLLKPID